MKVAVICEYSGVVRDEFIKIGHEAISFDILDTELPGPHVKGDVMEIPLEYWKQFDLAICHPPCTYLSNAGARWLYPKGELNKERYLKGLQAKNFFEYLYNLPINKICIENPKPSKIFNLPKETQVIQPYQFGEPYSKRTHLWLKNLPPLKHTKVLEDYISYLPSNTTGYKKGQKSQKGVVHTAKEASKTFKGIAEAMANQWGEFEYKQQSLF